MKAYVIEKFGEPLRAVELNDPTPEGTEVVVRVQNVGLCHTDLHLIDGYYQLGGESRLDVSKIGVHLPHSLGHEIYGVVEAFGPESGLSESDKGKAIVVYPWIGCGKCDACQSDRDDMCGSKRQLGIHAPGGHAEKVVVRDAKFLIDAQSIDPAVAGLYACSGLTSYSALKKLGNLRDQWVAILGLGGVGMMALAIAKAIGFEKVIVADVDQAKLKTAVDTYGAELAFDARDDGTPQQLRSATGGGVTGVLDTVGSDATGKLGIGALKGGGTYVNSGLFGGSLQLPLVTLAVTQLTLRGSLIGTRSELNEILDLARQGKIKPIPAEVVPIAEVNTMIDRLRSGNVVGRIVLEHAPAS